MTAINRKPRTRPVLDADELVEAFNYETQPIIQALVDEVNRLSGNLTEPTEDYTAEKTDGYIVCGTTTGNITVTLPSPTDVVQVHTHVVRTGSHTVTIEDADGNSITSLTSAGGVHLFCTGTTWLAVSST